MNERSDTRAPLSVLIPVKNEAANLRDCLATVSFAQEIVVVDSESTDGTQAIAEATGAQVVQFVWNGKFPRKKNWALQNVPWQHEWVLIVDADERVTPELQREIRKAISRSGVDGFYLTRRFWFLDGWINHCGYFPSWDMRLFRHWLGRYEQVETGDFFSGDNEVHEQVLLHGQADYLAAPMEHYPYPDIATFLEKHKRYSALEAVASKKLDERTRQRILRATPFGTATERRRWLKKIAMKAPFRPSARFLYHYVWEQGFLDGYRGWMLCCLLASYERMIVLKERDLDQRQTIGRGTPA